MTVALAGLVSVSFPLGVPLTTQAGEPGAIGQPVVTDDVCQPPTGAAVTEGGPGFARTRIVLSRMDKSVPCLDTVAGRRWARQGNSLSVVFRQRGSYAARDAIEHGERLYDRSGFATDPPSCSRHETDFHCVQGGDTVWRFKPPLFPSATPPRGPARLPFPVAAPGPCTGRGVIF